MKIVNWWKLPIDESFLLAEVVYWLKLSIDGSCLLTEVVYWQKLSIDGSCLLTEVVYWRKLSIDRSCLLTEVVYWLKLSIDESCLVITSDRSYQVVKFREVRIPKKSEKEWCWWRFACGDVFPKIQHFPENSTTISSSWCIIYNFSSMVMVKPNFDTLAWCSRQQFRNES